MSKPSTTKDIKLAVTASGSRQISPRVTEVTQWGEGEVGRWLDSIGCASFRSAFRKHQILGEDLLDLDNEDLLEMGVASTVQRKWIMQQVSALRRKAQGKKAMEELYEEMGMFMPGPLSPRADSDGTNADDEEIRGELDSGDDDSDSDEQSNTSEDDDETAIKDVVHRAASPRGNKTVAAAPVQQEKSKGKREKTNASGNPFPGIPLYNDHKSPLSGRRDTVSGPNAPKIEEGVKKSKSKGLLKWGGKKKESKDGSGAKPNAEDTKLKEQSEPVSPTPVPTPTSGGPKAAAPESRKTQQTREKIGVPLDIAKFVSEMEAKQTPEKKKKKKGKAKNSDSEPSTSEGSHSSRRKTSETKTSVNASDVSISEMEPFEAPSDLAKRPQGVHLPLPTFEKHELVMGDLIAVTASGSVHASSWRGTRVALKQMRMIELNRSRVMSDFRNEVEILGKLRHPTIVAMMAYCCDPPDLFLMMEFMEGGSLHELLHVKQTKLNRLQKVNIALRIAQGMNFIHLSKIIHRDLKPQNILMDEHMRPKICDFGLSKTREHTLTHQGIHGTAPYMAPELLDSDEAGRYGGKSDERVDVYSFAIVLWELFTRTRPWDGKALPQLVYPVLSGKRPGPLPQKCPSSIKALIEMCWDGDFMSRPYFHQIVPVLEQEYKRQKALKRKSEKKKKEKLVRKSKQLAKRVKELEEQNAKVEEMMKRLTASSVVPVAEPDSESSSGSKRRTKRSGSRADKGKALASPRG